LASNLQVENTNVLKQGFSTGGGGKFNYGKVTIACFFLPR